MPKAYFVKVHDGITWFDVLKSTESQVNNSRKQLQYISIADLILQKDDFESLIACITQPHPSLASFVTESIADANGMWKCITIRCTSDARNIVIYTAGRTIPLYVAINVNSNDKMGT